MERNEEVEKEMMDILIAVLTSPITTMVIMIVWGMLIQNFWFNPIGKTALLNIMGRNLMLVRITTKSLRDKDFITKATNVEFTQDNNTYDLLNAKRYFIGNVPVVKFNEGNSTSPDTVTPVVEDRTFETKCSKCGEALKFAVPATIIEVTNANKVNAYLTTLRAFFESILLNRNQLLLFAIGVGVLVLIILNLLNTGIFLPSTGVDLAHRIQATYEVCNSINQTVINGAKVV